jgi:hypothetical protein
MVEWDHQPMPEQPSMTETDLADLARAKRLLENPGFIAKAADAVGTPIEKLLHALPKKASTAIQTATRTALEKALKVAVATLGGESGHEPSNIWHKVAVVATGAAGGAFGLASLPIELPVSTTIMLRSVADIARSKGEDLRTPGSALACIEVFALGARTKSGDAAESAYYAVRIALARAVSEAAEYLAGKVAVEEGAPALVRLIATVAQRFGVVVAEKAAAGLVPILGAAGGAAINVAFMDHFQDMAEGHFTVRSLERKHGAEVVRAAYEKLSARTE